MTIRNTYAAESWDKVYYAFQQINFTSYDYDTVKESLLQYLKIYHAEHFNDFIESSELIAILELFAYVAELLAYRIDTMAHENFITTAQRKQSVLRLARLISYTASRNVPARGLVKIQSIKCTEDVYDSLGNNLANSTIYWNDSNNSNWKEQFFLAMDKIMTAPFGQPSKAFQIGDVLMQLYTFNNGLTAFRNGVFSFNASSGTDTYQMEAVPMDIDDSGPFERAPDINAQFNIVYATDGKGDGSDYTGFLMLVKQGSLIRTDYTILEPTSNRRIELTTANVNSTDVWVYKVNAETAAVEEKWTPVDNINEQNLYFNDITDTRKKYEIETLENDKIALIFGDGNFSDMPYGDFQLWTRVSVNASLNIPKTAISGQQLSFTYATQSNTNQTASLTFSLTSAIQNNAPSETIEHIRQAAPSTYYAQNRMVNGQDYNTYMLKDQTILRMKTINRTFAGQPKYLEWNDASGRYENIKLFGNDLALYMDVSADETVTNFAGKTVIDTFIEPLLQTNALLNSLTHVLSSSDEAYGVISYPRRKFIEDNRTIYKDVDGNLVNPYGKHLTGENVHAGDGSLNEKTMIQAALDDHWYGEPLSYGTIDGERVGIIPDPTLVPSDDSRLYQENLKRSIDGINLFPAGDIGSGTQQLVLDQPFGLRFNRFLHGFGDGTLDIVADSAYGLDYYKSRVEVITLELLSDKTTFSVISNLRGKLPNYSLSLTPAWSSQVDASVPVDFSITPGSTEFEAGDGFVIDLIYDGGLHVWNAEVRKFGTSLTTNINLNGWWELIPSDVITATTTDGGTGIDAATGVPTLIQQMTFEADTRPLSWLFLVSKVDGKWNIYNRNMKIVAYSPTTKFWYNQDSQILDAETKKPVYDKIRVLRSNVDEYGNSLKKAEVYDVVGSVKDIDGNINFNLLEVIPADTSAASTSATSTSATTAGDGLPDNILQFESFSIDSYQYGYVVSGTPSIFWLTPGSYTLIKGYELTDFDFAAYDSYILLYQGIYYGFTADNFVGEVVRNTTTDQGVTIVRRRYVPAPVSPIADNNDGSGANATKGLDFMWQHFSPDSNLVDPSVTNIHDAFIMTRGYYTSVMDFVKGYTSVEPQPPTPFDLRTTYGYLLKNKMLSDTVVLHSGKIKLLFGSKADQEVRATFKVVKAVGATMSNERIKAEIISVIDTYFDIQNWDFGDSFYATELMSLIHQRLANQIASVVIVPSYSINSFGSLFTITSGFDEILQSAATVNDVEIVDALTPTALRQIR